jgi:hypothetical protein
MKTVLKIVFWFLIAGTVALTAFTVATAMLATPEKPEMQKLFDLSLNLTFYWGYALFATVIVSAIIAFFFNIITHPSTWLKTLLGIGIVGLVVGSIVAWVLSHEIAPVPNSAGGVFDNSFELQISETGLYLTYAVAAIAILVVVYDMFSGLVRRFIK